MAGALTISTLNNDTGVLQTQNGMTGIPKAWVQFNGSSATINGSFNVSSVTRASTGVYTVNFTTAMPNANYAVGSSAFESVGAYAGAIFGIRSSTAPTTTSVTGSCISYSGFYQDPTYVHVIIFSS